ncbi:MAG TPA: endonuclease/exonuclease/phosphatase family protein [Ignavibacteriales bacterium]|nr:endonuclease/exonuclease/phosphatase family protein [Ignavibacteriales bacterium]
MMKFKTFSIVFAAVLFIMTFFKADFALGSDMKSDNTVRVMTYNIRYAGDEKQEGEYSWNNRKGNIVNVIKFHDADIFGVQEALYSQIQDLLMLLPEYSYVGVGRDDGKQAGEYSAIFYKKDRFEVEESSTFWLSATPDTATMGWDAACIRICTWAKLKDKTSGNEFFSFNTHFDHVGETAQINSANLIVRKISEIAKSYPVVLTGDFNTVPASEVHKILTADSSAAGLKDAQFISKYGHYGENVSFNDFGKSVVPGNKIDYIFVKNGFSVLRHGIIGTTFKGLYTSDHMPVFGELQFTE